MERTYTQCDIASVATELLEKTQSKTLLFYGEMGAGKTTLIKALLRALGADDDGSSPTFSLVNEYESPSGSIYHFDFYRIEDETEALDMGIEEYLDSGAWIFIEWPQKIEKFLADTPQRVEILTLTADRRMLKFC